MGPLVIASHLPGEGHFRSERFEVAPVLCTDDYSYWRGLNAHWNGDRTLINIEHDLEVSDEHIAALTGCPHPLCSWAYKCHWASTGLQSDMIAAGCRPHPKHLHGGEEWADWSAIGLCKITPEARIGPLRREPWGRVELGVEAAVRRPWHMHGNGNFPGDASGHVVHHHW